MPEWVCPSPAPGHGGGNRDKAARFTGDEAGRATEVAESIRADVERLRLHAQPDLKLTISLGIAAAPNARRNARRTSEAG